MTEVATMPIYGKNLKSSSSGLNGLYHLNLVYNIGHSGTTKFVEMMTLGWPLIFLRKDHIFEHGGKSFHCRFFFGNYWRLRNNIWAPPSEFVSSSIPSWQTLTAYAQQFRRARDLVFRLKVPLDSLLVGASSEGSGETARMRRLAWTFAARIGDKYQIRLTRSIWYLYWTIKMRPLKFMSSRGQCWLCD